MMKFALTGLGMAAAGVLAAILGIFAIFFFAIIGALMGAITGFILQLVPVISPLVKEGFTAIGIANPNLTAIGAMLGFVGGFFKGNACNCGQKFCK